jgi:NADH dehydrogenase [ubiquinone] 1 alpha subcomplex assembly factor 7
MSGEGDTIPLAETFRRLIRMHGPISLMHYMGESNARYYAGRDPLGREGDFVTAPEISQIFGELIGLWLTDMWDRAGRPEVVHYVELGPGRGTLARDALRAMKRHDLEPRVHLVEASTELRALQLQAVPDAIFHEDLSRVPVLEPVLLVANEFLDALPIRQLVLTAAGWREVMVGLEGDDFVLVAGNKPMDAAVPEHRRDAEVGTVIETCPGAAATVFEAANRLVDQGGAALFIDYGHVRERTGSTLQAVRAHKKVDAFAAPGEMDLTAHVDFASCEQIARSRGCKVLGTVTQGRFLKSLGIRHRAEALGRASPQHREELAAAVERLTDADEMGELFMVMGLAAPNWPEGAGFA